MNESLGTTTLQVGARAYIARGYPRATLSRCYSNDIPLFEFRDMNLLAGGEGKDGGGEGEEESEDTRHETL